MVASSDQPSGAARSLAARLRDLREREFTPLTQQELATALGGAESLSGATVSTWENPSSGRLPPERRLVSYARLFCSRQSLAAQGPRLLADDELNEDERDREAELRAELLELRERARRAGGDETSASDRPSSIWRFGAGEAISIVCSDAPAADQPPYAHPAHLNYSRYARHADLDALIEVYGQIRAENPSSPVRIMPSDWLWADHALNNLVVIGGGALDVSQWFARGVPLPAPREVPLPEGRPAERSHVFRCEIDGETRDFASLFEKGNLVEDVGLLARCPHPTVPERTVTVCSGITSRGVHGAALCFMDSRLKNVNEQYIVDRFGAASMYCILMRIPVVRQAPLPQNLTHDEVKLYEWSDETGAQW